MVCSVQHFVYTYAVAEGDLFVLFAEISGFLTKSRCTYCNRPAQNWPLKCVCSLPGNETAYPTGCARPGPRTAGPATHPPCSLPQERNSPGRYHLNRAYPKEPSIRPQAAVINSGVWVRMGAIAVFRPPGGEAQTAAGPRGRRYLPKTARCAPQALEAGAFWDHRPKSLSIRSLAVLLRKVACCFSALG